VTGCRGVLLTNTGAAAQGKKESAAERRLRKQLNKSAHQQALYVSLRLGSQHTVHILTTTANFQSACIVQTRVQQLMRSVAGHSRQKLQQNEAHDQRAAAVA
jgi:hypothetical protein